MTKFQRANSDFSPKDVGSYFAKYEQNTPPPIGICAQAAVGTAVPDQYRNFLIYSAMCHQQAPVASLLGSASSLCCCTFFPNLCAAMAEQLAKFDSMAEPISFKQIVRPPPKNDQNWGVG